jgi:hypothetical protein
MVQYLFCVAIIMELSCGYFFFVEFPFEFRALEVILEGVCSFLDARTRELETAAYPALDELTSKVIKSYFAENNYSLMNHVS